MNGHTFSVRTYLLVCLLLIAFTFLTVGISFAHLSGLMHIVAGLTIGLVKATLVILFFMHVLLSTRLTWTVIMVTAIWLGILLVLTYNDYFSRNLIPFTPGH